MESATDRGLSQEDVSEVVVRRCRQRAKDALAKLKKNNPKAHAMVVDPSSHVVGRTCRRAGKTHTAVLAALCTGESKPGAITLIISLNLKQLKRLYWDGPSGIRTLARKNGIVISTHGNDMSWTHENGSMGYLLGCDDDEQLEVIRGLEADLYIIDECKSFSPNRLEKLIVDIITPQRASRRGRLMMIGTPGHIFAGPFYRASCERARDKKGRTFFVRAGEEDPWGRDKDALRLWSLHTWTLQDNAAMPHQWEEALITKANGGDTGEPWPDDHPSWLREYLGEWTASSDGLVYRYATEKATGGVTWVPVPTEKEPHGLPIEGAPWRFVAGLDIGYEAPTAFVVCAYSSRLGQLRHMVDYSVKHLLVHQLAELISGAMERFGNIEKIYADKGNLGKMIVETLVREYGFPIEAADKREKFDHIELLNSAFSRGEVKILEGTELETQLLTNAWDLDGGTREELGRLGKLREDKNVPNDSTDALIYLYRGSLHHFKQSEREIEPERGTREWHVKRMKDELAKVRRALRTEAKNSRLGTSPFKKAPAFVQRALTRTNGFTEPRHGVRASSRS